MRRRAPRVVARAEDGFALVETLVAAVVIAGMTAVLFQTVATEARVTEAVRARRRAAMLAQSALDEATSGGSSLSPGASGQRNGLSWQVLRAPFGGVRDSGPGLERVSVRVRDPASGRPLVTLQTLRLVR